MDPVSSQYPTALSPRELVSQVKRRWQQGVGAPDAQAILAQHPDLRAHASLALDLAYEEWWLRREAGETLDPDAFCRRFPSIGRSLYRQIEVDEFLRQNPLVLQRQAQVDWPRPGDELLGFRVLELLGQGAFARVYRCGQPGMGHRQVVVKVAYDGAYEAATMGRLDHPNVMPIYSVQQNERTGISGICMPFVGRATLCDVLDEVHCIPSARRTTQHILQACTRLEQADDQYHRVVPTHSLSSRAPYLTGVLQLAVQLASALTYAHAQGVVHGDLKPSNVVMTPAGTPLLVDFNLAYDRQGSTRLTGGTLPYMAPEQIENLLRPTAEHREVIAEQADIYSLGAVLFELITGTLPFAIEREPADTTVQAQRMVAAQRRGPADLGSHCPHVDRTLQQLVERCLQFEPPLRFASMQQLAEALQAQLAPQAQLYRWSRIHRRGVLVAAGGVLAAGGGLAARIAQRPPPRDRFHQLGCEYLRQQQYPQAIDQFSRSLTQDPLFVPAFFGRGRAYAALYERTRDAAQLRQAREDFRQAMQLDAAQADRWAACVAYCNSLLGAHEVAVHALQALVDRQQVSVPIWNNLGLDYWRYAEQLRLKAVQNPANRQSLRRRADELMARSERCFLEAVALDSGPQFWQPRYHLARRVVVQIHQQLPREQLQRGFRWAEQACQLQPNHWDAYYVAAILAASLAATQDSPWSRRSIELLQKARDHGYDCQRIILQQPAPFHVLADHPQLQALLALPRPARPPAIEQVSIFPLPFP